MDTTHDTCPLYDYCKATGIILFICINLGPSGHYKYKYDLTIDDNGVPVCKMDLHMHHDGVEKSKHREKCRCPLATRKNRGKCPDPCSNSKY